MVCNRCITVVTEIFKNAGISCGNVQLGKVTTSEILSDDDMKDVEKQLNLAGFELINDSKSRLIEQIRKITIDYVYNHSGIEKENFSTFLTGKMNIDYNYMSSLYSSVEGTTIERHLISLRIERVKELLVYHEMTLSEIAWETGYSSVAHLSGQFKKITGFTPSYFRQIREEKRKSIDKV